MKRGQFQAIVGAVIGLSSVIAPLIGGAFVTHVTWHWCFYLNLPIGGIAFLAIFVCYKPLPSKQRKWAEKLAMMDYIGTILLTSGIVLLLLALNWGGNYPWQSVAVILNFCLAAVLLVGFAFWNCIFSKVPLVPNALLRCPAVVACALGMLFMLMFFTGTILYLSVYFQIVWQATALQAGVDLLPFILAFTVFSVIGGVAITKTGLVKPFVVFGISLMFLGAGLLTLLDNHSSQSERIGLLILPGVGIGFLFQGYILSAQLAAPAGQQGLIMSTSLLALARSMGGAVGSAIAGTIFNISLQRKLNGSPKSLNLNASGLANNPGAIAKLPSDIEETVIRFAAESARNVFFGMLGFAACAFAFSMFTTSKRFKRERPEAVEEEVKGHTAGNDLHADAIVMNKASGKP